MTTPNFQARGLYWEEYWAWKKARRPRDLWVVAFDDGHAVKLPLLPVGFGWAGVPWPTQEYGPELAGIWMGTRRQAQRRAQRHQIQGSYGFPRALPARALFAEVLRNLYDSAHWISFFKSEGA